MTQEKEKIKFMKTDDLIGKKFGRLTVLSFYGKIKKKSYWNCKCDCGNKCMVERSSLITGKTKSCGCYKLERARDANYKHHCRYTRIYTIYNKMKQRCYNEKDPKYKNYGGRGIKICKDWLCDFMNFYKWAMNNGYSDNLTIERINVNDGYEPKNCKWIPQSEQAKNRTTSIVITIQGKSNILSEWCKQLGISYRKANYKYHKGCDMEKFLQNIF